MRAQEPLDGIRVRPRGIGGNQRVEEVQELLRGARRKGVDRMSDDVGMNVLGKVEANRATARARILRIVIGNSREFPRSPRSAPSPGVEFRWMCGARVSAAASGDGVNTPASRIPFA